MKVVVDTNIIFSGLLNSNTTIGDLLFNPVKNIEFYSCSYMRYEIDKHWEKLKQISKLTDIELQESRFKIFSQIRFISEELISPKVWKESEEIVKDIDIDDIDFVALTKFLKGYLWTGDKALYKGLKDKNFKRVFNTSELITYRNTL